MSIWEISLALANSLYNIAYIFLVLGAIFTAASTVVLFWTSGVRDKYASIEIAEAHASSDQAKSTAASAGAIAALAQQKTSELSLLAEQERVKFVRLQAQLAWRTIPEAQVASAVETLKRNPGAVHIQWVSGDVESLYLAEQIATVFHLSGWKYIGEALVLPSAMEFGLVIPDTASGDTPLIRVAFQHFDIGFDVRPLPKAGASFGKVLEAGEAVVFVDSKLPPQLQ